MNVHHDLWKAATVFIRSAKSNYIKKFFQLFCQKFK